MRLFLAIDLPAPVKSHLANVQQQWVEHVHAQDHLPTWTNPANLHLTLKFLGNDVPPDAATRLTARLQSLPPTGPFPLLPGPLHSLPPRGPIRVIAVDLDGETDRLQQLVSSLESACELEGFPAERRPFLPHVTIG